MDHPATPPQNSYLLLSRDLSIGLLLGQEDLLGCLLVYRGSGPEK
jgi:hypothetical protein